MVLLNKKFGFFILAIQMVFYAIMSMIYGGIWSVFVSISLVLFMGLKLSEMSRKESKNYQGLYTFALVSSLLTAIIQIYKLV